MERKTTREDVAEWYTTQVLEQSSNLFNYIEWLTLNLKDEAFNSVDELYDEHINNLEAESFFK